MPAASHTVLIVEDHPDVAEAWALLLESQGYDAVKTGTVAGAIKLARDRTPDVIIMDVGLPDGTGITLLHMLRAEPHLRDVPILAATGWVAGGPGQAVNEAPFTEILQKPVEPAALVAAVRRWAAKSHAQ